MSFSKFSVTHFILLALFPFLSFTTEASPIYSSFACTVSPTYKPNSTFEANLNVLLSVLTSNGFLPDGFLRTSFGEEGTTDAVNGLFLCRGDTTPNLCQECVADAAKEIRRLCPNQKESIIWYDVCLLRYSNYTFNPLVPFTPLSNNSSIASAEQDQFNQLLSNMLQNLAAEAKDSRAGKKFATGQVNLGSSQTLYGLEQCNPDMTPFKCKMCIQSAIGALPSCCSNKKGATLLLPGCNIRYELYPFFNITQTSSVATVPPRSVKGRTVMIVVVSSIGGLLIFLCLVYYLLKNLIKTRRNAVLREKYFGNETNNLESLRFSLATIEAATNKFSNENCLGQGGFGRVYKGVLSNGQEMAIKRLSKSSDQGAEEFKNEVLLIAKLQHRNLVALLGFCIEEREKVLIYEYVPNKSLDNFLFGSQKEKVLNWVERYKIIGGVARGILYLHEYSRLKVIHRDLKPSNILLDNEMNPKISDFGLAKLVTINTNEGSTNRIVGTYGYMSPEYAMYGQYSEKSDVFSFGVMVLEIISGKKNTSRLGQSQYAESLLSYAWKQWKEKKVVEILDPNIEESGPGEEVVRCIQIGLLCVQGNPDSRPTMAQVVSYLSNDSSQLPLPQEPTFSPHAGMEPSNNGPSSIIEVSMSEFFPR